MSQRTQKNYIENASTTFPYFLFYFAQVESVDLALNVLDGYDVRGNKIKVQRAQFQMKGDYNPALKPKVRKAEKQKIKKMQEKWVFLFIQACWNKLAISHFFSLSTDCSTGGQTSWEVKERSTRELSSSRTSLVLNFSTKKCTWYLTIKMICEMKLQSVEL